MNKLFIDTNVALDILLDRAGSDSARMVLQLSQNDQWTHVYMSYLSMANMAYVMRKLPPQGVKESLLEWTKHCTVLTNSDAQMLSAIRECASPDFEDALQIMCAEEKGCSAIITNNVSHFAGYTDIPVFTPDELLSCLDADA